MKALFTLLCLQAASILQAADQPNVVLFLVDDMGWMDSEPYGSKYYKTPNMERLSKQSMRFTNAYATPLCSPTLRLPQKGAQLTAASQCLKS
jgi:hypothetical protein|tara:strand:+ start:277 stop:552 length:276 start_codon:yes stop_codon:yes gene_type:complete